MEIIAAIALGIATYNYLDTPDNTSVGNEVYTETTTTTEQTVMATVNPFGTVIGQHVSDNQPNVKWVFVDG